MARKKKKKSEEDIEINLTKIFSRFNVAYVLLLVILLMGFSLRFYHINYPVIGYHNWKVAHYITEARNFAEQGFFKYGFFVPMRDSMGQIDEQADGAHNDTFPTISIVVGMLFEIFGQSLFIARLANIIFSLGAVVFIYLLIKELFGKKDLALISAFLASINPLFVFFSHNVQVVNPGLFFMTAGFYFYVKWLKENFEKNEHLYLYIASFCITFATLTKYTYAVAAFPILFSFPYRKFFSKIKKNPAPLAITGIIVSIFPAWFFYMENFVKVHIFGKSISQGKLESFGFSQLIDLGIIFDSNFWITIESYVADNYTIFGVVLMSLGLLAFCFFLFNKIKDDSLKYYYLAYFLGAGSYLIVLFLKLIGLVFRQIPYFKIVFLYLFYFVLISIPFFIYIFHIKGNNKLHYQFMYGYLFGFVIFFFIMGFKMSGHNYHQFPIAPFAIFLMAYFLDVVARNLSTLAKSTMFTEVVYIAIVLLILFTPFAWGKSLYGHSIESKNRMFNTQFPGLDVAGAYMKSHKGMDDRMYHSSGQSFGVLWHADMPGYKPPGSVEQFMEGEDKFNVSWVFAYEWGMNNYCILQQECNEIRKERGDYLKENYRLVQMAYMLQGNQARPVYFLFRKGGSFNETQVNSMIQGQQQFRQVYELTTGQYELIYVNLE